jgi:hypothetical protein
MTGTVIFVLYTLQMGPGGDLSKPNWQRLAATEHP